MYHYVLHSKYCVLCNTLWNNVLRMKYVSNYLSMHKLCKLMKLILYQIAHLVDLLQYQCLSDLPADADIS